MTPVYFTVATYILYAVVVSLLIALGLLAQIIALVVFTRKSFKARPINALFINLICANLIMIIVCYPLVLVACIFHGEWKSSEWEKVACLLSSFVTGTSNIAAIISLGCITRQISLLATGATTSSALRKKNCLYIVTSWVFALVCMLPSVTGWSSSVFEPGNVNCAPNWTSNQLKDISYLSCLTILAFVLPLTVQVISFVKIRNYFASNAGANVSTVIARNRAYARRKFSMAAIATFVFFLLWTPYAVCCILSMAGKGHWFQSDFGVVPAIMAKSTSVFSPFLYCVVNSRFRKRFVGILLCRCSHRHEVESPRANAIGLENNPQLVAVKPQISTEIAEQ